MFTRSLSRPLGALGVALALVACGGTASQPPEPGGGTPSAAGPSAAASAVPPAAGAEGYEGTFTTSGLYAAIWSAPSGSQANPFNASESLTVASDKNTFGNIGVKPDGSVSFGSAATEFGKDLSFEGTGAHVTLDATGQFVCAFTVDTDLKGHADNAVLHLSGGMTVHWHPNVGGLDCP
ncbi:MAG: hypothetical protein ACXWN2_10655 [Candidatus Limnocylindrales bacterium]